MIQCVKLKMGGNKERRKKRERGWRERKREKRERERERREGGREERNHYFSREASGEEIFERRL